jgi:AraC-like DNA-binding protein
VHPITFAPAPLEPVTTVLLPVERTRVDAAGEGRYRTLHRDSLDDVFDDLRDQRAGAVVLSVARCGEEELCAVARLVREFPRVTAVALLSLERRDTPRAVLGLGQSGVKSLVDVRHPEGWGQLRDLLSTQFFSDIDRLALGQLSLDLIDATDGCWRFFSALFDETTSAASVRALAVRLMVLPTTLMSRFFRANLPSPKRYLASARLVRAARAFENPGLSVASVSDRMEYSSPQSFGRHVRTLLGMTALEFRDRYNGESMLRRFREDLVYPHLHTLTTFDPLSARTSVPAVSPAASPRGAGTTPNETSMD